MPVVQPGSGSGRWGTEAVHLAPPHTRGLLREPRHVVAALRVLVFGGLTVLGWSQPPAQAGLFWVVTVIYGLTIFGYLAARNAEYALPRVRYAMFLFDVAVVSTLLVLRGRDVTALVMAYFTLVLMAGLLAGIGNALLSGLAVSAVYTVVTCWGVDPASLLGFDHLAPPVFFFVIAVFMGHVADDARVRAPGPSPQGELPSLRDSMARLRAAREGAQARERLHTLGLFSAGIAHELRRPLAVLLSGAEEGVGLLDELRRIVKAGGDPAAVLDELSALFEDSGHAAARLQRVATDLHRTGRGGTRETRAVPATETLADVEGVLRKAAGAGATLQVRARTTRRVLGDPARLRQILLVLADNAFAALGRDGGTVRLEVRDAPRGRVAFVVEDDGSGIAPEVQERMYDPFFTTRSAGQGSGLGLFVLREIVSTLRGEVQCTSSPGRGTQFRVEFPAEEAPEEAIAEVA